LRHAPVFDYPILRVEVSEQFKPAALSVEEVLTSGMVPQYLLQHYLEQIPFCREIQERTKSVVQRLGNGAFIEDGYFFGALATRKKSSFSRDVFVTALGEERCQEIELAIGHLTRRRLVLRDSKWQLLGWHVGNADLRLATGNNLNST